MPNTSFSSSSEDVSDDVTLALALARFLFSMIFVLHVCIFSYKQDPCNESHNVEYSFLKKNENL